MLNTFDILLVLIQLFYHQFVLIQIQFTIRCLHIVNIFSFHLEIIHILINYFSINVRSLRDLYPFYNYSNLAHHPAIIHLPYQVSTMSLFEQYTMNIPLVFPSLKLLTKWHLKYGIVSERTWDRSLTGQGKNHSLIASYYSNSSIPDPNNEFDYSSIYYWLKYADFYQWPYIIYFDSVDDLVSKLLHTNFTSISQQMSEYNLRKRQQVLAQWRIILDRIRS